MNDFIVFTGMAIASLCAGTLLHFLGWQWVNIAALPMIVIILIAVTWLKISQRQLITDRQLEP
jgi:MFS family permease